MSAGEVMATAMAMAMQWLEVGDVLYAQPLS